MMVACCLHREQSPNDRGSARQHSRQKRCPSIVRCTGRTRPQEAQETDLAFRSQREQCRPPLGVLWGILTERPQDSHVGSTTRSAPSSTSVTADPVGVLWALGAMVGAAAYFILSARQDTGLPPIALAGFGLFVGGTGLGLAGLVGILPLNSSTDPVTFVFGSVPFWIPLLALSLVSAALAYALGIISTRMLGSRLASFVALSEVVAAVLYGWLLVGQVPGLFEIIGGVLVLVGVVIVKLGEKEVDALA